LEREVKTVIDGQSESERESERERRERQLHFYEITDAAI
jgi:adenosine/AMP kinase